MRQKTVELKKSLQELSETQKALLGSNRDLEALLNLMEKQNLLSKELLKLLEKEEKLARLTEKDNAKIEKYTSFMAASFRRQAKMNRQIASHTRTMSSLFLKMKKDNKILLKKIKAQVEAISK